MIEIIELTITPFSQNARIIAAPQTRSAVVVDPGGCGADLDPILEALQGSNLKLEAIWLTHAHLDHCGGVAELLEKHKVPLYAHANEKLLRGKVEQIAEMYGIPPGMFRNCPEPDHLIDETTEMKVGEERFKVLFTPGHSPGHVCFYHKDSATLLCGDTVFAGSIGRTDFPQSDHATLMRSIREKILVLPGETKLLPGHGPNTTVAHEAKTNPFITG